MAGPEQPLERDLPVVPVPHLTGEPSRALGRTRVVGADRPLLAHQLQHLLHEVRMLAGDPPHPAPGVPVGPLHPPAHERLQLDRDKRRLVRPVLEQLAPDRAGGVRGEAVERLARVRAQAREVRHVVRAREDVDRVELEDPDALQHPPQMPRVDPATRARVGEALRRKRDPPCRRGAQPQRSLRGCVDDRHRRASLEQRGAARPAPGGP